MVVYDYLLQNCKNEAFQKVTEVPLTDKECGTKAWEGLNKRFNPRSLSRIGTLLYELQNLGKITDLGKVSQFIDQARKKKDQLTELGVIVDDAIFLFTILRALPEFVYQQLLGVIPIELDPAKYPVQLVNALNQIKHNCMSLHAMNMIGRTQNMKQESADHAQEETRSNKKSKCFNCHKTGHTKAECYKPGGGSYKTPKKCENCDRQGHTSQECFREGGGAYKKRKGPEVQKPPKFRPSPFKRPWNTEFAAMVQETASESSTEQSHKKEWLLDSGASSHMSPNESDFLTLERVSRVVRVANDQTLEAVGIGMMQCIVEDSEGIATPIMFSEALLVPGITKRLVSAPKMVARGNAILLGPREAWVMNPAGIKINLNREHGNKINRLSL